MHIVLYIDFLDCSFTIHSYTTALHSFLCFIYLYIIPTVTSDSLLQYTVLFVNYTTLRCCGIL